MGCLVLAFYSGWKLALVVLAFLPFIVVGSALEMKMYFGDVTNTMGSEECGKVRRRHSGSGSYN